MPPARQIRHVRSELAAAGILMLLVAGCLLLLGGNAKVQAQPAVTNQVDPAAVFAKYFVPSTLALQRQSPQLQPVAVAGQNEGGQTAKPAPSLAPINVVKKAAVSVPVPSDPTQIIKPVPYTYISQEFNIVTHPGLDLVAPYGTPIVAAASGCITETASGWNGGYGNLTIEDIGGGYTLRYAHQELFADGIQPGACVDAGTVIGYVGLTGHTTGPHLHFELRKDGVPVRPDLH